MSAIPVSERIAADVASAIVLLAPTDSPRPVLVERLNNEGNLYTNPRDGLIVVFVDYSAQESAPSVPQGQTGWHLPIDLICYVLVPDTNTTPIELLMAVRVSDVLKQVTEDVNRSNIADDTIIKVGAGAIGNAGNGLYWQRPRVIVKYRTYFNDPYASVTAP